ncbi:hypothetical protein D2V93_02085 [Flagellimonas taeanensis]|uniref:hypothetical protein n=1 Tax=Flavobacteriaceae TaxID=49546 RepID=UPI000E67F146|nr:MULTISPECIES: hypothetical protein [Allomuricauda]MDC6384658.1 hypothetical protein [Muricauda sp. SK9]RIV53595.1 hypothetical protein D2V93_02085 [Allomuricauda taeanensis]
MAVLFLMASSFFAYSEYSAYQKRKDRYTLQAMRILEAPNENGSSQNSLDHFKPFQEYRNVLYGYEAFLLDLGMNYMGSVSYKNTIRDEIMAGLENQEYGETYWNTVFNITFEYEKNTKAFHRSKYGIFYVVPADLEPLDMEETDYGDLNDAENYAFFERMSQLLYIGQKIKSFDRSPENIGNLWNHNKSHIYTFFSKSKYDELCKQVVDDLIEVHDSITTKSNYEEFYKMYDVSDDVFLDFPSVEYTSSFEYSWPFSFWDRRFAEDNASKVYAILKEIQNHYKN